MAVTRQAPLPPVDAVLTGGALAPLVPACGLLLLAAAVALIALRGWGRVVLGVLVAAAGVAVAVAAVGALTGSVDVDGADLGSQVGLGGAEVDVHVVAGWPVLALVAGLLGAAGGALVALRGRGWPGMGQRYQRTGTAGGRGPARPGRPESAEDRHRAGTALDRRGVEGAGRRHRPDRGRRGHPMRRRSGPHPAAPVAGRPLYGVHTDPTGEGASLMSTTAVEIRSTRS